MDLTKSKQNAQENSNQQVQKMPVEKEEKEKRQTRQNKINNLRQAIKSCSILKKNSLQVEAKQERTRVRRQSLIEANENDQRILQRKYSEEDETEQHRNGFQDKYDEGKWLGEGANGYVRECVSKKSGYRYAVKCARMDQQHILQLRTNFAQIKGLHSPYIVPYRALYFDLTKHVSYLIMELVPLKNLLEITEWDEAGIRSVCIGVLKALKLIHARCLCHRDIKPENILYDTQRKKPLLIDFGISTRTHQRGARRVMLTIIGTAFYLAPEVLQGGGYDERVDMWAFGITIYRLIQGRTPFQSEYHRDTINNINRCQLTFRIHLWAKFHPLLLDFVKQLICPKQKRLSVTEALRHPWILQKEIAKQSLSEDLNTFQQQRKQFCIKLIDINKTQNEGNLFINIGFDVSTYDSSPFIAALDFNSQDERIENDKCQI